jgi:hypothetical protein
MQHYPYILHLQIIYLGFLSKLFITFLIFHVDYMVTAADMSKCLLKLKNNSEHYECGFLDMLLCSLIGR